ncbi:MAG: DNA-3-methyladenine glycosylase family protein [Bacteroidales bacterium]
MSVFSSECLSNEDEKEIIDTICRCLALETDLSEFYRMAEGHPILKCAKNDLYGMRVVSFPDLFNAAILAVTLQRASRGRTRQMIKSLHEKYGKLIRLDGYEINISPSPQTIGSNELMQTCRLGYRASYITAIAKSIISSEIPTLEELSLMSPEKAKETLNKLKGIGEYSAEVILFSIHPFFPVDAWSAKIFRFLFKIKTKKRNLIQAIKQYAQSRFGVWQSYAYEYILNDQKLSGGK